MSNHGGDSYQQEDSSMRGRSGQYDDQEPPRQRSRSRSPLPPRSRDGGATNLLHPVDRRTLPQVAEPSNVLGVFGLSIRTTERDLEDEFSRSGKVEKVVIVYDARSDRSRGFGFVTMASVEDADRAISDLNGIDLHGRRIRVDFSATKRPHDPTPGQYRGIKRDDDDFPPRRGGGGGGGYDDRWGSSRGGDDRWAPRPPPRRDDYSRRDDRDDRYSSSSRRDDRDRDDRSSSRRDYGGGRDRSRSRSPPRRRRDSRSPSPPRRERSIPPPREY
ncbi:BQ2448_2486 [Microbotryum intermedium]|uniref:BQ2448_2486 protein n=1 Tax=Microbotryum intermedium TaxID=269621 RepID=A0A238FEE2_9BASI|nr:BQ2448_2486 [Microbotryum intermedium]